MGSDGVTGRFVPHVVVVDPHFEKYKPLATSARLGKISLHFRSSGADAIKLARRRRVDAWIVAPELDDMAGHDFVELLQASLADSAAGSFSPPARVAMVGDGKRVTSAAVQEAIAAGADSLVSQPITFRDLEDLLQVASLDRTAPPDGISGRQTALVALPISVGAAVVAIAVLMMG
jgi:CheY-like chemotaxis protein